MELCARLPLNSKFARKCPCKNKTVQQFQLISVDQLFKVHEHMLSALAATDQWPCRWRSAWTRPREKLTAASDRGRSSISRPFLFQHFWGNSCSNRRLLKHFKSNMFLINILSSALNTILNRLKCVKQTLVYKHYYLRQLTSVSNRIKLIK